MNADPPALGGPHDRHRELGREKPADQELGVRDVHLLDDLRLGEMVPQEHAIAEEARQTPPAGRVGSTQHAKGDFVSICEEEERREGQAEKN
jgi:hypothetical protein